LPAVLQHYVCRLIFVKHFFFNFIINFQKEKANTLTLLIILIVKSLQIAQIFYYDPQSAGINVQSQSATTRLLGVTLAVVQKNLF
jgi:hypothetical protein